MEYKGKVYAKINGIHSIYSQTIQELEDEISMLKSTRVDRVPVSIGDIYDRVSILKIKIDKINDKDKLKHVIAEFCMLKSLVDQSDESFNELMNINEALWEIEDAIREKEKKKEFDDVFIELARSVYMINDKRAEVKRRINETRGSSIVEVKSYKKY